MPFSLGGDPRVPFLPLVSVQRLNVRPYILGIPANDRVSPAVHDNAEHEEICPKTCRDLWMQRRSFRKRGNVSGPAAERKREPNPWRIFDTEVTVEFRSFESQS